MTFGSRRPTGVSSSPSFRFQFPGFPRTLGAWTAAALAVLTLGFAAPASAAVLVSNIDQAVGGATLNTAFLSPAQGFTTGSNTGGYTLSSIEIKFSGSPSAPPTVQLATGLPSSTNVVATLISPSTLSAGNLTFTAPANTTLSADTTYYVVVLAGTAGDLSSTLSNNEDSGGETGWSVANERLWRVGNSGAWSTVTTQQAMIRVNGTVNTASPDPTITISGGPAVTEGTAATFMVTASPAPSADLTVNLAVSESAGSDYVASTNEGTKTVTINANATQATYSVPTQDDSVDESNGTVTVQVATGSGYTVGTTNSANVTVNDDDDPIGAPGGTTAPVLSTAVVNGVMLTLTYNEALDANSVPAASDFTVTVDGNTVSLSDSNPVAVSGSAVTLTLAEVVTPGQTVTVSYTKDANPIQNMTGDDAAALVNQMVTTLASGGTMAPTLSTATVNGATLALTFDTALDTTAAPETQRFSVTGTRAATRVTVVTFKGGDAATVLLTLNPAVTAGKTGILVSYTADDDANPLQDPSGRRVEDFSGQAVANDTTGPPAGRRAALERTLAALGRQMLTSALDGVNARFVDASPDSDPEAAQTGQQSEASSAAALNNLKPHAGGLSFPQDRGLHLGEGLNTFSFNWTTAAAGANPLAPRWGVWGRGDAASFEGRPDSGSRYKGDTRSVWLGVDARSGPWVAGLAASRSWSDADYRFDDGDTPAERGRLETTLTALYPYGRWRFGEGRELRALLGTGDGTAYHTPETGEPTQKSNLSMRLASVGLRQALPSVAGVNLAVRADAGWVELDTESGIQDIDDLTAESWQARVGVEASRYVELANGAALAPFLEVVGRREGGDVPDGSALEVAGGVRYSAARLQVEMRGRVLAAHSEGGMDERGASVTARLLPEAGGRGLSLSLSPRWGAAAGSAEALWRNELPRFSGKADETTAVDARIGYGMAVLPGRGLLTPFVEASLASGESRRLRVGTRFEASWADLVYEVFGERSENAGVEPDYRLGVNFRARF